MFPVDGNYSSWGTWDAYFFFEPQLEMDEKDSLI